MSSTLPAKTVGTYLWAGASSGTPSTRVGPITGYGAKCVDVAGANPANGTKIQLWTCNGTTAQSWTVGTDGTLRALGKCLDVAAASSANGTKVQLYDCNGSAAQTWTAPGDGTLRALGKCLDATGPSSADGTQLQIWTCGTAPEPALDPARLTLGGQARCTAGARLTRSTHSSNSSVVNGGIDATAPTANLTRLHRSALATHTSATR